MKWSCAFQPCDRPALRSLHGQCEICNRHFCAKHVTSALHTCPTVERGKAVISGLLAAIDSDALRLRAESLRDGMKCTVKLPSANQAYGNYDVLNRRNYHGSVVFDDGKTWLARFRLPNHCDPPVQERNFDRLSEFATYRFLASTNIPVPEVYDFADDDDPTNPVGAGYILLEKLAGKPLAWHEASEVQKYIFFRQLADIYARLKQHPLDGLGRLQLSSKGLPKVGPAFFDYDSSENLIPFGPFSNSNDYYTALIHQRIQLIKTGEIASSAPRDQYLVYMSLLDSLPPNESGPFFICHVDSRDTNFLIDDDYNITGIIDWELAIFTAKSAAFQSPLMLYNLGEIFDEGLSTPSEDEKRLSKILREEEGAAELSTLAENKLHFRVDQVIEADPWNRENFVAVFSGWWKAAHGVEVFDWETWYKKALEMYGDGGL
ncbi:kinase-like domain-containing protein [Poronia punctata]|nr:kinase-like domain-containing protein [Poronia punctata]